MSPEDSFVKTRRREERGDGRARQRTLSEGSPAAALSGFPLNLDGGYCGYRSIYDEGGEGVVTHRINVILLKGRQKTSPLR